MAGRTGGDSVVNRTNALAQSISDAYTQIVVREQALSIDQRLVQTQIMDALCHQDGFVPCEGRGGGGGEGAARRDPLPACQQCLELYLPCSDLFLPHNRDQLNSLRVNQCGGLCTCNFEAFQSNTMNFEPTAEIRSPTNAQLLDITRQVRADMIERYGKDFAPSSEDVARILAGDEEAGQPNGPPLLPPPPPDNAGGNPSVAQESDVLVNTAITNNIRQLVSSAQQIRLRAGAGTIVNVSQHAVANVVMQAILANAQVQLRQTVHELLEAVRKSVTNMITNALRDAWLQFRWYIIGLLVVIGVLIIATIGVLLTPRLQRRGRGGAAAVAT